VSRHVFIIRVRSLALRLVYRARGLICFALFPKVSDSSRSDWPLGFIQQALFPFGSNSDPAILGFFKMNPVLEVSFELIASRSLAASILSSVLSILSKILHLDRSSWPLSCFLRARAFWK